MPHPPPPPDLMIFILVILSNVQCISDYEIRVSSGFDSAISKIFELATADLVAMGSYGSNCQDS